MKHPSGLTFSDFPDVAEPLGPFEAWMAEAKAAEARDPDAVALATVDADGMPNVRMVLLKEWGTDGFVFYTNSESVKGRELQGGKAALVFYWKSLSRQVRLRGPVSPVPTARSDAYFTSRPRGAQIGAWASQQSRPVESRDALKAEVARFEAKFGSGPVARPPHWIGYKLAPLYFEFWSEQPFRLHDRVVFTRSAPDAPWQRTRLYP